MSATYYEPVIIIDEPLDDLARNTRHACQRAALLVRRDENASGILSEHTVEAQRIAEDYLQWMQIATGTPWTYDETGLRAIDGALVYSINEGSVVIDSRALQGRE